MLFDLDNALFDSFYVIVSWNVVVDWIIIDSEMDEGGQKCEFFSNVVWHFFLHLHFDFVYVMCYDVKMRCLDLNVWFCFDSVYPHNYNRRPTLKLLKIWFWRKFKQWNCVLYPFLYLIIGRFDGDLYFYDELLNVMLECGWMLWNML